MKKVTFLLIFLSLVLFGMAQRPANHMREHGRDAHVLVETNYGKIVLLLYGDTPLHRSNFLKLASEGAYDGLLFHRVIDKFMIQGGDPRSRDSKPGEMLGNGTLGYTIPAEIRRNHLHKRGALCAAREGNEVNPFRESSASQFYIVQGQPWSPRELDDLEKRMGHRMLPEQRKLYETEPGTPYLDGEYTVFGEVIEGMEVVDKIAGTPTDGNNRPLDDVRILHMEIMK